MSGRRILIVEDDSMIAEAISDIVASFGHSPTWVGSGPEALERLEGERFDLAVVDLELPLMPGIEVADRLMERQGDLRVLFATGFSRQEEQIDSSEPRIAGVIRKPFEIADLKAAVENALSDS